MSIKNRFIRWKQNIMRRLYGSQYKPRHFYSTIPSLDDYEDKLGELLSKSSITLPGIDLNFIGQKEFLVETLEYYKEAPFNKEKTPEFFYYYNNIYFVSPDAILLYLVVRKYRPKRIIEVGSGFSSAVIIDTNEGFFKGSIKVKFIEPFPDRLNWFLSKTNNSNYTLLESKVQEINWEVFSELEENDLLLIDSSHVSKLGSDVNYLFFNIIPRLKKGVIIHIHDVMYPFEYPIAWVNEKRFWNEAYLLRSFLTNNETFEVVLFNSFMTIHHKDWLQENMPILGNAEGGSIYIRKIK